MIIQPEDVGKSVKIEIVDGEPQLVMELNDPLADITRLLRYLTNTQVLNVNSKTTSVTLFFSNHNDAIELHTTLVKLKTNE